MTIAELSTAFRLMVGYARSHAARLFVTTLSILAAACVVVWVVSGYDSVIARIDQFGAAYLGRYSLIAVPAGPRRTPGPRVQRFLPPEFIVALRADPQVLAVEPVLQQSCRLRRGDADPHADASQSIKRMETAAVLSGTDAPDSPYPLLSGRWFTGKQTESAEGAISQELAAQLQVAPGDEVLVSSRNGQPPVAVRIVGVVRQMRPLPPLFMNADMPSMRVDVLDHGPADAAVYVSRELAGKISGERDKISYAGIVLSGGAVAEDVRSSLAAREPDLASRAFLQDPDTVEHELLESRTAVGARTQALAATGIALLAAFFIIFTTLSIGVQERARQFAMLRAVALTKAQVAAMILVEGLGLGFVGWLAGLLAGWGLIQSAEAWNPRLFPAGTMLGTWTIVLSAACAFGGSLAASILPTCRVIAVSPVEAMTSQFSSPSPRFNVMILLLGLILAAVAPAVAFVAPIPETARYVAFGAIGCTAAAVGFVLLTPATIIAIEKILAPWLGRMLCLNPELLDGQLSANLWRTVGTTTALTLGLGAFVAMQTWGYSMLQPFLPGRWMPDLLVTIAPGGASPAQVESISQIRGVTHGECLPLAVEQVKFADDITGANLRSSVTRQDNCIFVGVDTLRALSGPRPMLDFRFLEGTREEAASKMASGRYCLVPDHFRRESGRGLGSTVEVVLPQAPATSVAYEIVGVVAMDGWHLASKNGFRARNGRSAAMIIAPHDQVQSDFDIPQTSFLWMNLDGSVEESTVAAAMQGIIDDRGNGEGAGRRASQVRTHSTLALREMTTKQADTIIWGLGKLPLVALLVTSLGVLNTIIASIRVRSWEFGILRSIGVTRSGIVRLIIAEAIMIGIAACCLSFGFGVLVGYCGTEVSRYVDVHGGLLTPLVVPWAKLVTGFSLTLLLCLIAALVPAITTARCEPLALLQRGRDVS